MRSGPFVPVLCLAAFFATAAQRAATPKASTLPPVSSACSLRGLEPGGQAPSASQLRDTYNAQAAVIRSVRSAARFVATAGPRYGPEAGKAREVTGFVLVERPNWARIIGQAPGLGQNLFDMASDGHEFHLLVPGRFRFYTAAVDLPPVSTNPYENVRPQHVIDALLWSAAPADATAELASDVGRGTIRLLLRPQAGGVWPARIVEFERTRGVVASMELKSAAGKPESIIGYADWEPVQPTAAPSDLCFPRQISIERPNEDYRLELRLNRLAVNEDLAFAQFRLEPPRGVPVVRLNASRNMP